MVIGATITGRVTKTPSIRRHTNGSCLRNEEVFYLWKRWYNYGLGIKPAGNETFIVKRNGSSKHILVDLSPLNAPGCDLAANEIAESPLKGPDALSHFCLLLSAAVETDAIRTNEFLSTMVFSGIRVAPDTLQLYAKIHPDIRKNLDYRACHDWAGILGTNGKRDPGKTFIAIKALKKPIIENVPSSKEEVRPTVTVKKNAPARFHQYADEYANSERGDWLRKAKGKDVEDAYDMIDWLAKNMPKDDPQSMSFLTQSLAIINITVRDHQKSRQFYAGAYDYFMSEEGAWLDGGKDKVFEDPNDLIRWIARNKPDDEGNSLAYLSLALSFCNESVRKHLPCLLRYVAAYSYIISEKGKWLKEAMDIAFKNPRLLVEWIEKHRPKGETNSLSYLVQALGIVNKSVAKDISSFQWFATGYSYIHSKEGEWLRKAINIRFEDQFHLIRWLIAKKPKDETNTLGYLANVLCTENIYLEKKRQTFITAAAAYDYIGKSESARRELNRAYRELRTHGHKKDEVTTRVLGKGLDRTRFLKLRKNKKTGRFDPISPRYLRQVVQVYLAFVDHFLAS